MPGSTGSMVFFFLLFLVLVYCFKDFIAALGVVYLFAQLFMDETMQRQQKAESSFPDQVRRLFGWPSRELSYRDQHQQLADSQSSNGDSDVERRPLLYESRVTSRRRHTETDIHLPSELLTPDDEEPESFSPETLRGLLRSSSYRSHPLETQQCDEHQPQPINRSQSLFNSIASHTIEAPQSHGSFFNPHDGYGGDTMEVYEDNQYSMTDSDAIYDVDYDDEDDVDEFFLATDFADPLPKADYSQSVSCLQDLMYEQRHMTDFKQRYVLSL